MLESLFLKCLSHQPPVQWIWTGGTLTATNCHPTCYLSWKNKLVDTDKFGSQSKRV
jgi:hypothetical protein